MTNVVLDMVDGGSEIGLDRLTSRVPQDRGVRAVLPLTAPKLVDGPASPSS